MAQPDGVQVMTMSSNTRTDGTMKTKTTSSIRSRIAALVATSLLASVTVAAATVGTAAAATDIWVCAKPGSASVADPATGGTSTMPVAFTGFVEVASDLDCATAIPQLGDPTPIRLTQGVTYNLNVVNQTGFPINLTAVGLTGAPDLTGIADTATDSYEVTPAQPGTYLYESSLDPRHALLGLQGVIVVDPAVPDGTAHGNLVSDYSTEQVVVISEIDLSFNNAVDPFVEDLRNFKPDLYLLNGQTHTAGSAIPPIVADSGERVLLRYVNASSDNSTMTVLGLRQIIVAFDGEIFDGSGAAGELPRNESNIFLTAGQTADVIVTVDGATGDQIAIYNRNLRTSATDDNGEQLLMIEVGAVVAPVAPDVYLSLNNTTRSLAGVVVRDEDVALWDGTTISVFFDGESHGLIDVAPANIADIDAVHVDPVSGDVWFSLRQDFDKPTGAFAAEWAAVPDVRLQENDIFKFDNAAGTFSVWLDGSAIGLSDGLNRHDINGVSVDPVSGVTTFSVNGSIITADGVPYMTGSGVTFGARNEDVLRWIPVSGAADPSGPGQFNVLFDGTDFGLGVENLDAVVISATDVMFSLTTEYPNIPTPEFDRDDLIACRGHQSPPLGSITDTCTAPLALQFDADVLHPTNAGQVDAYSLG